MYSVKQFIMLTDSKKLNQLRTQYSYETGNEQIFPLDFYTLSERVSYAYVKYIDRCYIR